MGINRHSVPSKYKTSFSATSNVSTKKRKVDGVNPVKSEKVAIPHLPPLPNPSNNIKNILLSINNLDHIERERPIVLRAINSTTKRLFAKIDGFIAFRSFYAKSIKNIHYQRLLSSLLSTAWKSEVTKDVWRTYAIFYNASERKSDFVNWLCSSLNLHKHCTTKENNSHDIYITETSKSANIQMEDIYLIQQ